MNVAKIVKNKHCSGCGLCHSICPQNCIKLPINNKGYYQPIIDNAKCTDCGLCIKQCPSSDNDLRTLNSHEKYGYGYSRNATLQKEASSGGICTELLIYLLNQKIVDQAVVVSQYKSNDLPKAVFISDPTKISTYKGSKYCPVPVASITQQVKQSNRSTAIVGLPCHLKGMRTFLEKNDKKNKHLYIGLFCNNTPSFHAINFLSREHKLGKIKSINYRGGGWPGYFTIESEKGTTRLPFRKTMGEGYVHYFKHNKCQICNDPFASYADIALADAYFLDENAQGNGNTFWISRSPEINEYLQIMSKDQIIAKDGPDIETIRKSFHVLYKRINNIKQSSFPNNIEASLGLYPNLRPILQSRIWQKQLIKKCRKTLRFIILGLNK